MRKLLITTATLAALAMSIQSANAQDAKTALVNEKMCYGGISHDTMNAVVRSAVAKVGGPQLDHPVDELIYMNARFQIAARLGVQPDDRTAAMPAFMLTPYVKQAATAMTACFPEVQDAVAKQQALIAESKKPKSQLFVAYKLYAFAQFCHQLRQGYVVVYINDVEMERLRVVTKAIERRALVDDADLNTDALWRSAHETAMTKNSGWYGTEATCRQAKNELMNMSPVSVYTYQKP
jgi:hypothetical protein